MALYRPADSHQFGTVQNPMPLELINLKVHNIGGRCNTSCSENHFLCQHMPCCCHLNLALLPVFSVHMVHRAPHTSTTLRGAMRRRVTRVIPYEEKSCGDPGQQLGASIGSYPSVAYSRLDTSSMQALFSHARASRQGSSGRASIGAAVTLLAFGR